MENITNKFKKICEQKGFTLIELLGVIIILAVIALITYPIVDKSIQRSRESALERTIENIEGAAYNYSVEYDLGYPREQQILELKELANKGFISDKEHINPVTNNELEGCVLYRWNEATSQYYFKYAEPCVRTEIAPTMTLVYDKENINENDWLNKNIMVNINGTGTKYYYCIGNTECEPNIEENKTNGTKIIINEGTNVLCAKAENAYGESKVVCTEELNLDKTAPNIEGIGDKTVQRNTNVDLITGVTYNDALSGISGELIIEPTIVDTSVTGTKVVKYKITDKAGNTKEATRNIIVDAPAPTITYNLVDSSSINSNGWAKSNFFVRATITDNSGSGINIAKSCSSNSSSECTPSASFTSTTKDFYIQTEGNNRMCIEVTDNNNKTSKVCSDTYKLDKTLPTISGLTTQTVQRHSSVDLKTGVTYNDALSGISGELIIEPASVDTSVTGTKTVKYKVTDKAGNTKEATRSIIVDAPSPTITYTLADSNSINGNGWAKSDFFVRATITDNSGSGIKSTKSCSSNSSNECTPSASFTGTTKDFYIQAEGDNKLCIEVTDNNNKTSKICSDTYKLDKTLPTISGLTTQTVQRHASVDLKTGVTYNDALSGISGELIIEPSVLDTSVAGTKTVKYKIRDKAGNTKEATRSIIVDAPAPTITYNLVNSSSVNSNGWAKSNFFVRATITDNSGTGIKTAKNCSTNSSNECTPSASFTGTTKEFSIQTEGDNKLCIEVTDNNNKTSKVCSDTYKLDKTLPNIAGVADKTVQRNTTVDLKAGVTYSDALSGISGELIIEPASVDTSVTGTKTVKYKVTDKAGNTREVTRNIIVDAAAPTITYKLVDSSSVNSNGWAKSNFFVRATITDNSGSGIKTAKSCSSNSSSECTPVASFTGTTKDFYIEVEGNNRLCIEVADNNNKTSKICSDTYKLDKTAPTAGTATFTGTLGSNSWYTSNVTVNKVNGSDSLSGHSSTTSNISSITSNTSGTKVTITTTDLAGNSSTRNYTIKIDKNSPTITAKSGTVSITEGDSNATSNYFTVSYGISGGSLSCSPTNTSSLSPGTRTVTCTATGGNGKKSTATKQIEVKPKTLISALLQQYNPNNTTGLVKDETNENLYYYTGNNEQVNSNFLWYGGHQWRIMEFDTSAKTLTLITQQPLTAIQPSSVVWATKQQYESSYVNTWLNEYFWNSLDSSIKNNILNNTFNVGIYTNVSEITTTQKVGLLDEAQYVRAGYSNSYLNIKDDWWLGNRYSSTHMGYITSAGVIYNDYTTTAAGIRVVIKISNIDIVEGNGTLKDSYRGNSDTTSTSDVQVGEYINVPYSGSDGACGNDNICTFRVVSKDNDSIKVILNGLISKTSSYGTSTKINTYSTIYTVLNQYAQQISSTYRYTNNKVFNIGSYVSYIPNSTTNYKDVANEQLSANVGLPTIGEMFSGNDVDLVTGNFVDPDTVENFSLSSAFWTMNRYDSSSVRYVNGLGSLYYLPPNNLYGVRPVIFLKNNLKFTGGEGTAQNPYTLQ